MMKVINRKRYSEAFKKEAVMRVMGQNSSSYKLGVSQSVLSKWVKKFKEEGGCIWSGRH